MPIRVIINNADRRIRARIDDDSIVHDPPPGHSVVLTAETDPRNVPSDGTAYLSVNGVVVVDGKLPPGTTNYSELEQRELGRLLLSSARELKISSDVLVDRIGDSNDRVLIAIAKHSKALANFTRRLVRYLHEENTR